MKNRDLNWNRCPSAEELYALERAARVARATSRARPRLRGMLETRFWKDAAASLPASVRTRHLADLERAERWELALDRAIEAWARLKNAAARSLQPRGAY